MKYRLAGLGVEWYHFFSLALVRVRYLENPELKTLLEFHKEGQIKGWSWNTEHCYPFSKNDNGEIEIPTDKKVLFICAAGVRSGLACEMAASIGFDSEMLYNIEDGTNAWITSNYPTEKA